jgi:DNA polymerase III delta subunit
MAVRALRELIAARAFLDRHGGADSAALAAHLGRPEWLARRLLGQAARYSADELRRALTGLADVELTMKTSQPHLGRLALERWLLSTCQA